MVIIKMLKGVLFEEEMNISVSEIYENASSGMKQRKQFKTRK